jgi:hypothetical protein
MSGVHNLCVSIISNIDGRATNTGIQNYYSLHRNLRPLHVHIHNLHTYWNWTVLCGCSLLNPTHSGCSSKTLKGCAPLSYIKPMIHTPLFTWSIQLQSFLICPSMLLQLTPIVIRYVSILCTIINFEFKLCSLSWAKSKVKIKTVENDQNVK